MWGSGFDSPCSLSLFQSSTFIPVKFYSDSDTTGQRILLPQHRHVLFQDNYNEIKHHILEWHRVRSVEQGGSQLYTHRAWLSALELQPRCSVISRKCSVQSNKSISASEVLLLSWRERVRDLPSSLKNIQSEISCSGPKKEIDARAPAAAALFKQLCVSSPFLTVHTHSVYLSSPQPCLLSPH